MNRSLTDADTVPEQLQARLEAAGLRRTLATREESIKLAKLRFDNGVASELDYRQAQSLTEAARPKQAAAQTNPYATVTGTEKPPSRHTESLSVST